jgi:ribosome biogenesis GTPase A
MIEIREYIDDIEKSFPLAELSYFELNLETWRQLWRVLEMTDILLVVIDSRFPVKFHSVFTLNHYSNL